jgi:hypothetical protein
VLYSPLGKGFLTGVMGKDTGAVGVKLTDANLRQIDEAASEIQAEGERYAPAQMAMVGREAAPAEGRYT